MWHSRGIKALNKSLFPAHRLMFDTIDKALSAEPRDVIDEVSSAAPPPPPPLCRNENVGREADRAAVAVDPLVKPASFDILKNKARPDSSPSSSSSVSVVSSKSPSSSVSVESRLSTEKVLPDTAPSVERRLPYPFACARHVRLVERNTR